MPKHIMPHAVYNGRSQSNRRGPSAQAPGYAAEASSTFPDRAPIMTEEEAATTELPRGRRRRRRAVVVGAGLAGLGCALELKARGWEVVVVEARSRTGGRVSTTTFMNGAAVDVGASFIHGVEHNPVAELAMLHAGVDLYERLSCPLYDGVSGRRLEEAMDSDVEAFFNRVLAAGAERKSRFEGESLERAFTAALGESQRVLSREETRALGWHLSNLEYSVNADLRDVANNGWDDDDSFGLEGPHTVVGGSRGMSCVVDVLVARLTRAAGSELALNCAVESVAYHDGDETNGEEDESSEYDGTGGGVVVTCHGGKQLRGDVAIVTVPLGVLKAGALEFIPPLPKRKKDSISRLGFGLLNKITLLFAHKFWGGDEVEMFGLCAERRGDFPIFVDGSHDGFAILVALASGTPAAEIESSAPDRVVASVLSRLRRVFGRDHVPDPLETSVTAWRADPFARGSYSFVAVGSSPADYDVVAAPLAPSNRSKPRVFFAGEATTRMFPASVHGAYFSGLREASLVDWFFPASAADGLAVTVADSFFASRFRCVDRLWVDPEPFKPDDVTLKVYLERYAPKETFLTRSNPSARRVGHLYRSLEPVSRPFSSRYLDLPKPPLGAVPSMPLAMLSDSPAPGSSSSSSSLLPQASPPRKRLKPDRIALPPGTRVEIEWPDGRSYDGWLVALLPPSHKTRDLYGVYYAADMSFERVDLSKVKWRVV